MKDQTTDSLEAKPIGPLTVQPEQWSQGARIAICHPDRGVIAVIEPINNDDDPTLETAERELFDEAYARLFAAAPDLLEEVKRLYSLYHDGEPKMINGRPAVTIAVCGKWAERLRRLIATAESAEEAAF